MAYNEYDPSDRDPYNEGYDAGLNGYPFENPYAGIQGQEQDWELGYADGEDDGFDDPCDDWDDDWHYCEGYDDDAAF